MMRKAVFIPLTRTSGRTVYVNAFWIGQMIDRENGTTEVYYFMDYDKPILVKENSLQIISMIKREANKYEISLD